MQLVRNPMHRTIVGVALIPLLAAALCMGAAAASAGVPTTPRAITPAGHVVQVRPSFSWSKSYGSKSMEIRVYRETRLILRKTGIKTRPWQCGKNLPSFAGLRWKVRGVNASGAGRWSTASRFRIEPIDPALVQQWWGGGTAPWCQMIMSPDGTFVRWLDAPFAGADGMFSREGRWAVSGQTIRITHLTETWEPTPMDQSGITGYSDQPLADCVWTYALAADGLTLDIVDENAAAVAFRRQGEPHDVHCDDGALPTELAAHEGDKYCACEYVRLCKGQQTTGSRLRNGCGAGAPSEPPTPPQRA